MSTSSARWLFASVAVVVAGGVGAFAIYTWGWHDMKLFGQIAMPIHLYTGNAEVGFDGQVGFTLPFMNK